MLLRPLICIVAFLGCSIAFAQQPQCDAAAFREVVSTASAAITQLHEKNNKLFQEQLQKLRVIGKWSDAEFLAKATPFVKDETTASFDAANQLLLEKIQSLEASNAGSDSGRCMMLAELKTSMEKVVANTAAKWAHMIAKVSKASPDPLQAGVTQ